ncbi:MAG: hypothetical protein E7601_09590 [Ruminococcaceae bacterium]|nr:hypothetical protein [Oscillospiraceae bacterium]
MTYDRYYNLISKVARVKRFIKRHWLVFSIAVLALVFVSLNFVYSFGSFTEGVFCEDSVYGEQLHFGAKTFLSSVSFEFSSDGETWSDDVPVMPGEYTVRATTVNPLLVKRTDEASFKIEKREMSISVNDTTVIYGSPAYAIKSEGLIAGDTITDITYIADSEPTDAGVVSIDRFRIINADGEDVSSAYNVTLDSGELIVEKRPIVLSVKKAVKEYDATPITPSGWYVESGSLAEGDSAVVTYEGTQTEIGRSVSVITSYKILDKDGRDVTYCYDVQTAPGIVEVEKIRLVFSTGSLTAEYDGTKKICHTYDMISGKFFGNDKLVESSIVFHVEAVFAGEYRNTFSESSPIVIKDSVTGEDVSDRYSVTVSPGTIKITKRKITVKTDDVVAEYCGMDITLRGELTVTVGSLAASDSISLQKNKETIINVGSIENKIEILSITNKDFSSDAIGSYDITYDYGTVTVVKRKLTVKSPDLSKVYDGEPLVPEGGLVFLEGSVAELDRIKCEYFNTITEVGSIRNDFTVLLGTDNPLVVNVADNYELTVITGTLRIYPREITLKSPVSVFTYTGDTYFTQNTLYLYDGTLAYGHSAVVLTKSSITDVGTVENVFTADIRNSFNSSVARNYIINYEYGSLVVLPKEASGLGRTDIYGEAPPTYDIEVPKLNTPHDPPPNANIGDEPVDYTPPNIPPSDDPGSNNTPQNPVLPPQLNYPSQGEDTPPDNSGNNEGNNKDDEPLFYILTEKKQTIFLRGTSYGNYNGKSWDAGVPYSNNYLKKNPLLYASDRLKSIPGFNAKTYELKIKGTTDFYSTYFSSSFPDRMLSDIANIADSSEYSVFFYDFEETRELVYNSEPFHSREIDEYTKWVYKNYLDVDPSLKQRLIEIAAENGVYATSPTLISDVVYYLKKTAKYNLNYSEYPEDQDTIIYFLTTAKEGICIHYAGAAALLYRSYGIPARVAVGYKCQSKAGEWTPVKSPAHAWVEIYIDGAWYPIEATPSGSGSNLFSFSEDPIFGNQNAFPELRPEIFIEFPSVQKYYDGKALKIPEVKVTGDKLKKGHKLIAHTNASITYVGSVKATVDSLSIVDENGNDVSSEYCLRIREGTFTVLPIVPSGVQKLIYMNSGDLIFPARQILIDLYSGGEDRIVNIPKELLWSVRVFDGGGVAATPLSDPGDTDPGFKIIGSGKATVIISFNDIDENGDGVLEYQGTDVHVTLDVRHFSNVRFRNVTYESALRNYSIDISRKNVYTEYTDENGNKYTYLAITTASASKKFDGRELTAEGAEIISGALIEGHSLRVNTVGARTYTGVTNNDCESVRILDENGNDVTYMYSIDVFCGMLTVEASSAEPDFSDITIEKDGVYDFTSVDWVSLIDNYPLTVTVAEGGKFAICENSKVVGIKQGESVVEVTFAAVDLNFDGLLEYDNVVYSFKVNVYDPDLYENMFVVILVTLLAAAVIALIIFLKVKLSKKKVPEKEPIPEEGSETMSDSLSNEVSKNDVSPPKL